MINEDTDLQTLLKIIQSEKDNGIIERKGVSETFPCVNKLAVMKILPYYTSAYNLWYHNYCSARDLICELTMTWLLLLAMNPLTGWFYHPFVFGWTQ